MQPTEYTPRECVAFFFAADGHLVAKSPCWDLDLYDFPMIAQDGKSWLATEVWFHKGLMCVGLHEIVHATLSLRMLSREGLADYESASHIFQGPSHAALFARLGTLTMTIAVRGSGEQRFLPPGGRHAGKIEVH